MAEKEKKKRGGRRCVAGAPNSTTCGNNSRTPGISMHQFPKNEKTRALWVRFVQRHRSDFDEPVNQYAVLCSAHFERSCFTTIQHKDTDHLKLKQVLQRGSVPTRDTIKPPGPEVLIIIIVHVLGKAHILLSGDLKTLFLYSGIHKQVMVCCYPNPSIHIAILSATCKPLL